MADLQFIIKLPAEGPSDNLAFPPELVCTSKEMNKLDDTVYLTGPGGKQCGVKLLKKRGLLYLEAGWKDFIQDHYVMGGDHLVFKYLGNSCFSVLIFDKSGCERESSYFVKNEKESASAKHLQAHQKCLSQSSGDNESRDDAQRSPNDGGSTGDFYTSKTSLSKRTTPPDKSCKPNETDFPHNDVYASKLRSCQKTRIETKTEKEKTKISGSKSKTEKEKTKINGSKTEARALRFVKSGSIKNPCFHKVLPATSVLTKYALVIPENFVVSYRLFKEQKIVLQSPRRKKWVVDYSRRSVSWVLLWRAFVVDNGLKEGDACVFELTNHLPQIVMIVHIFRAS